MKYDIVTLIELVENRPCIWDKTSECYKDKLLRQKAWEEVYTFLEEDYMCFDKNVQLQLGKAITGKWKNLRDAFLRSLRNKPGQPASRKYIYHDNLQFYMKVVEKDDTDPGMSLPLPEETEESELTATEGHHFLMLNEEVDPMNKEQSHEIIPTGQRNKRRRLQDLIEQEVLKAMNAKPTPDEDEAFFNSVITSVRHMSEDQKLEFRMGVLALIKHIKQKNNYQPSSVTNLHSPGSSS